MQEPVRQSFGRAVSWRGSFLVTLLLAFSFAFHEQTVAQPQRALGVDISYWNCGTGSGILQGSWNTGFSTGNRVFVVLRATRGGTTGQDQSQGTPGGGSISTLSRRYDDPRFGQNLNRAVAAGMYATSYHFARPDVAGNTGTDEADHFLQMAGPWMRPGYLMPMFDQEAGSGGDALVTFANDFSARIYAVMQIRPCIYINGNYSSIFQGASVALRNTLAQPQANSPSVVGPAYPMLWNARYGMGAVAQTDPSYDINQIPIQTGSPQNNGAVNSSYYGPWDDYGNTQPWSFWQYASVASVPGFNDVDANIDVNVSHGDLEYVRNYLIPAVWWNDSSGDWSTLANWNSGQTPVAPVTPAGQATPYEVPTLPTPRLPGAAGSGSTSGQFDTVILERPSANITVTVSTGTHNVRKLYMRETLNLVGGSLTVNYNPAYRPNDSVDVLHAGPISAQFSGSVTMSNGASFAAHTLQVDATRTFTLAGGTYSFVTNILMPHSTTPAKLLVNGSVILNPLTNVTSVIAKGSGAGTSGSIDLGGQPRAISIGNSTADVDVSVDVPVSNGGLTKAGAGTLRLTQPNTYAGGTIVSLGRLLVNNTSGSGTGSGDVTVNGGVLGGTGTISGLVTVNSAGTIAAGASIGTMTLNTPPSFSGTNFVEINRNGGSPLADKIVLTSGTLTYGGTLVVSNAGAALVGGDVFTLFSAPAYAGEFANAILPSLGVGWNWHLGDLTANGTIKVNRRPVANPLTFTNVAPAVLQIPFATLTGNATDADGDTLVVSAVNLTTTNGITLTTNGTSVTYSNSVSVTDQFSYIINDGHGGSTTGLVNVVNIAAPAPPAYAQFTNSPSSDGSSFTLQFLATPGYPYYVERSTNLVDWDTISTNVAPPSGVVDYTDLATPPSWAFYRLRWTP